MLDQRAHSTEGGLEGREPIGRLFGNVEEDLGAIDDSLPLCWQIPAVRELARWKALNPLTSIRSRVTPAGPGIRQTSFWEHGSVGVGSWVVGREIGRRKGDTATTPADTQIDKT